MLSYLFIAVAVYFYLQRRPSQTASGITSRMLTILHFIRSLAILGLLTASRASAMQVYTMVMALQHTLFCLELVEIARKSVNRWGFASKKVIEKTKTSVDKNKTDKKSLSSKLQFEHTSQVLNHTFIFHELSSVTCRSISSQRNFTKLKKILRSAFL